MTTLMIKTHNVTGLKYFCKTSRKDVEKYTGSGRYWLRHLKKHGKDITTEIYGVYDETHPFGKLFLEGDALLFSEIHNIVNSKINGKKVWANERFENGLDGNVKGNKHSKETKKKMSKPRSKEARENMKHDRYVMTDEIRQKISKTKTGIKQTEEHKRKKAESRIKHPNREDINRRISESNKKARQNLPILICPHCGKEGKGSAMKQWHFDKCKKRD